LLSELERSVNVAAALSMGPALLRSVYRRCDRHCDELQIRHPEEYDVYIVFAAFGGFQAELESSIVGGCR